MAQNILYDPGFEMSVVVTDPAAPNSGDAVRWNNMTGIALVDEGDGGNAATETTVNFGDFIADIPVTGEAGAIAVGDKLYYDDAIDGLNNDAQNGYFFGYAREVVEDAATTTIEVWHPGQALAGALTERDLAKVAADNAVAGIPVLHQIAVAGGAAANEDIVVNSKVKVIDAWAQHTGGAGEASDTIQLFNGANAISDAIAWSGADNVLVRAGTLNDANTEIAAGGTLRVTTVDDDSGDDVGAGIVYVLCVPVA
jgi:predicted RecA/RadA family phage recombinase